MLHSVTGALEGARFLQRMSLWHRRPAACQRRRGGGAATAAGVPARTARGLQRREGSLSESARVGSSSAGEAAREGGTL